MASKKTSKSIKKAGKKAVKKPAKKVATKAAKKPAKKAPKKSIKKSAIKKTSLKKSSTKKKPKSPKKSVLAKAKATVRKVLKKAQKKVETTMEKVKQSLPSGSEEHPFIGSMAPKMKLQNQNGQEIDLSEVVENNPKVVLYFYPKDDTPGCTTQACGFRDNLNRIQASSAVVLGVSPDSPDSHKKFAEKFGLNFDLLSDINKELSQSFQVWKEKEFMGKKYMGVDRSTFLFHNGRVVKVWQPVKVQGHVDEVLAQIESLG